MKANKATSSQTKLPATEEATTFVAIVEKKKTTEKKAATGNPKLLLDAIIVGMEEVKAHEISVMDLRKIGHATTDYFVVCHGNTGTQVKAISQSVESETIKRADERPLHTEGVQNAKWILMDYGNVVVHIFDKESRAFYALEELWGDAEIQLIAN